MKDTIERIQDWYKINCDGDWEHYYGYQIETLDNPGWSIKIDLSDTSLENLEFKRDFQNANNEYDWFNIQTKNKKLNIYCGPENMKQVLDIFFDELIPKYSDKNFPYEIYLPLKGMGMEIWTPAKARLVNEKSVQIIGIEKVEYKKIKVRDVEQINFSQTDLENMEMDYFVGQILEVQIENVFDGMILIPKN